MFACDAGSLERRTYDLPYLPTREHQVAQDRRFLVARVRRPRAALATYRGLIALGALGLLRY